MPSRKGQRLYDLALPQRGVVAQAELVGISTAGGIFEAQRKGDGEGAVEKRDVVEAVEIVDALGAEAGGGVGGLLAVEARDHERPNHGGGNETSSSAHGLTRQNKQSYSSQSLTQRFDVASAAGIAPQPQALENSPFRAEDTTPRHIPYPEGVPTPSPGLRIALPR